MAAAPATSSPAAPGPVEPDARGGTRAPVVRRAGQLPYLLLLAPAVIFLALMFTYPLVDILLRSIRGDTGLSAEHYTRVIERPVYLQVFWITLEIAAAVTVLTLLLGFPLAYVLASVRGRWASLLMLGVLMPFFTSILVRTYAWMVILGSDGLLNHALRALGLGAVTLLYNRAGVLIGMTYALLPYMVLTLYSVIRGIDRDLLLAARNLGAGDWQAFRRVFLPLSLPGVAGGSLLVFILALGYFITPRLMGGDRDQMVAMVIENQVELALNFNFASALATLLLLATLVGFLLYERVAGLQTLFESKSP